MVMDLQDMAMRRRILKGLIRATQGYPTLAIDGLGSGDSSHQDPVLVLQTLAEMDVLHRVVQAARTAKITAIPTIEHFWRMFCKSN
jgi:hypothetical protein